MSDKEAFDEAYASHEQYESDEEYRSAFTFGAALSYACVCLTFFALGALAVESGAEINSALSLLGVGLIGGIIVSALLAYGIGGTPGLKARYNAVWARKHAFDYHKAVADAEESVEDARSEVRLLD